MTLLTPLHSLLTTSLSTRSTMPHRRHPPYLPKRLSHNNRQSHLQSCWRRTPLLERRRQQCYLISSNSRRNRSLRAAPPKDRCVAIASAEFALADYDDQLLSVYYECFESRTRRGGKVRIGPGGGVGATLWTGRLDGGGEWDCTWSC